MREETNIRETDWFRCSTITLGASFARGLLGLKRAHLTSPAKTVLADLLMVSTQDSTSTLALLNMEGGGCFCLGEQYIRRRKCRSVRFIQPGSIGDVYI